MFKGVKEVKEKGNEYMNEKFQGENGDQYCISYAFFKNPSKYDDLCLDYNCRIFYTAVEDWFNINNCIDDNLIVKHTKTRPCVIHVPNRAKTEIILFQLFLKYISCRKYRLNN